MDDDEAEVEKTLSVKAKRKRSVGTSERAVRYDSITRREVVGGGPA